MKTAVLNIAHKEGINLRREDMCTSFENNISEVLVDHAIKLAIETKVKTIALAGGVSANKKLRELLQLEGDKNNIKIYLPDLKYCTDNAAMITCAGILNYRAGKMTNELSLNAKASMDIEK